MPVFRLCPKRGDEVAHCGVAGAFRKTDLPQGRIALRDAGAKAEFATVPAPGTDQIAPASRIVIAILTARSVGSGQAPDRSVEIPCHASE
jgi:hypothetical protein